MTNKHSFSLRVICNEHFQNRFEANVAELVFPGYKFSVAHLASAFISLNSQFNNHNYSIYIAHSRAKQLHTANIPNVVTHKAVQPDRVCASGAQLARWYVIYLVYCTDYSVHVYVYERTSVILTQLPWISAVVFMRFQKVFICLILLVENSAITYNTKI